ncbi:MAG: hypothetical protein EXR76_18170 [Myxococcales bacterium]|nr:hypothetical protein [Myxococcales bacterium]
MDPRTTAPLRRTAAPLTLALRAAGPPSMWVGKTSRLALAVAAYGQTAETRRRLRRLAAMGVIHEIPTSVQLTVGAIDMMRFWIAPAAAQYYGQKELSFTFHQVLRFLDEPASLTDPLGLLSTRDSIIGHLMQVVHASALYDLQLLTMFDDGLDGLEAQLIDLIEGRHARSVSIAAIIEESDYHARLLGYVRTYRMDPTGPSLRRSNVEDDPRFAALEETFGSMTDAFDYFTTLPTSVRGAVSHLRSVKVFSAQVGPVRSV